MNALERVNETRQGLLDARRAYTAAIVAARERYSLTAVAKAAGVTKQAVAKTAARARKSPRDGPEGLRSDPVASQGHPGGGRA